ncbi:unnamed protein product, partial [Didymodactylos carnosus]
QQTETRSKLFFDGSYHLASESINVDRIILKNDQDSRKTSYKDALNDSNGIIPNSVKQTAHIEKLNMIKINKIENQLTSNSTDNKDKYSQSKNMKLSNITIANKTLGLYIHFDLKGAAPKIIYFQKLFPLLKKWGAIGICIEYEDVFPFDGILKDIRHKQAYTVNNIKQINKWARENDLDVIPLIQTYGHLEFLLKIDKFSHLRENLKYPQVITPCINQTFTVLYTMIDQYLNLYPNITYFHIGCDEVYYFLSNTACIEFQKVTNISTQYELFAYHVSNIAKYIHSKRPTLLLLVWHDVLQNLGQHLLSKYNLLKLINPVLWSYREDVNVEGFLQEQQAQIFGQFQSIWGASAFKGATSEISTISDIKHYYLNQQSWIAQLNLLIPKMWQNFDGMIVTGWSRYDHFLSLCELLPYSIPSLAYSITAWIDPFKNASYDIQSNQELQQYVDKSLGCNTHVHTQIQEYSDQRSPQCTFPGADIYEAIISLQNIWKQVEQSEQFADKFVTDLHLKFKFIHVKRSEESLEQLKPCLQILDAFLQRFQTAMDKIFPPQVAIEWLETYFMQRYKKIKNRVEFIEKAIEEQKTWKPRPIPDLDKLDNKRQ